jgi:hypothetical protein
VNVKIKVSGSINCVAGERRRQMAWIKNEHIVWAFGDLDGGGQVVICGLTEQGLQYLKNQPGQTLLVTPPAGVNFTNVKQIIVFHEKDKETLKARLRESGKLVSEAH